MKISSKSDVLSNLILPNQINLSGQISLSYRYRLIFQGKKKSAHHSYERKCQNNFKTENL